MHLKIKQENTRYDIAASKLFYPLLLIIDAIAFLSKEKGGKIEWINWKTGMCVFIDLSASVEMTRPRTTRTHTCSRCILFNNVSLNELEFDNTMRLDYRDFKEGTKVENIDRRTVLGMTAAGLAGGILWPGLVYGNESGKVKKKTPVLHVTDLFRPHMDPDDHWDLACVYSLAYRGDIELKGVLIDHPPANADGRNPDISAVAQMNLIAGTYVPVAAGSGLPMKSRDDVQDYAPAAEHYGVGMVLDVLRKSPEPVIINILGSSRDIAIAGKKAPELFESKCAAIYLNAGTGSPEMSPASKLEYNVTLERYGFAAIFDLPCPVYWMPCFEQLESSRRQVREYGTHYKFRQDEILPHLSDMVQKYFAYMFGKYTDSNWLGYLKCAKDETLLAKVGSMYRHMWCTAGFLHAAGYTVTRDGKIVSLTEKRARPVFTFDAVKVECDDNGVTRWTRDDSSKDRFIFHVRDTDNYQAAMTAAMKSLLTALP